VAVVTSWTYELRRVWKFKPANSSIISVGGRFLRDGEDCSVVEGKLKLKKPFRSDGGLGFGVDAALLYGEESSEGLNMLEKILRWADRLSPVRPMGEE
jgi:hypothetical protein